jgi:hypothetical protein
MVFPEDASAPARIYKTPAGLSIVIDEIRGPKVPRNADAILRTYLYDLNFSTGAVKENMLMEQGFENFVTIPMDSGYARLSRKLRGTTFKLIRPDGKWFSEQVLPPLKEHKQTISILRNAEKNLVRESWTAYDYFNDGYDGYAVLILEKDFDGNPVLVTGSHFKPQYNSGGAMLAGFRGGMLGVFVYLVVQQRLMEGQGEGYYFYMQPKHPEYPVSGKCHSTRSEIDSYELEQSKNKIEWAFKGYARTAKGVYGIYYDKKKDVLKILWYASSHSNRLRGKA